MSPLEADIRRLESELAAAQAAAKLANEQLVDAMLTRVLEIGKGFERYRNTFEQSCSNLSRAEKAESALVAARAEAGRLRECVEMAETLVSVIDTYAKDVTDEGRAANERLLVKFRAALSTTSAAEWLERVKAEARYEGIQQSEAAYAVHLDGLNRQVPATLRDSLKQHDARVTAAAMAQVAALAEAAATSVKWCPRCRGRGQHRADFDANSGMVDCGMCDAVRTVVASTEPAVTAFVAGVRAEALRPLEALAVKIMSEHDEETTGNVHLDNMLNAVLAAATDAGLNAPIVRDALAAAQPKASGATPAEGREAKRCPTCHALCGGLVCECGPECTAGRAPPPATAGECKTCGGTRRVANAPWPYHGAPSKDCPDCGKGRR